MVWRRWARVRGSSWPSRARSARFATRCLPSTTSSRRRVKRICSDSLRNSRPMVFLTSTPRRIAKFARLSAADKRLFFRIFAMLVRVRVALWARPFQQVREMAEAWGGGAVEPPEKRLSAFDLTSLITVAACYIPRATCLTQALVAQAILRQHGYSPQFKIGVGRNDAKNFQAHAWIELDGKVVIGELPN